MLRNTFFPLAGFELRNFNVAVGKNKKIYREGRKKITRKFPGKGGKKYPGNFPVSWIVVWRAHYWTCKFPENLFAV
jgi:hypothetical protein